MRTTIISPSQLKSYKYSLLFFGGIFIALGIITLGMVVFEGKYILLFNIPLFIIIPISIFRQINRLRSIAYDENAIYYGTTKSSEIQKIQFENIRSIVLGRFDGIHKFNLITPIEEGKAVFFKTSLWYPFNFKRDDEKLYQLRDKIDTYKRSIDEDYTEQLPVYKSATGG